jgi:isopropylmalate/homocitrate/citramalate synthase
MLDRSGVATGVDLHKIIETSNWLQEALGKAVPALLPKAGIFPEVAEQFREAS